jgi:hypothetical protein
MDLAIRGRALYNPGPWGSKRPLRKAGNATAYLMDRTGPVFSAMAPIGADGRFLIVYTPPAARVTDFYIEIHSVCSGDKHMHHVNRPPNPRSFVLVPDELGDIEVPWEPVDAELAHVNSSHFKDTAAFAQKLSALVKSPSYPVRISLERESADGTGKDYTPAQKLLIPLKAPRDVFFKHIIEDIQDELMKTKSDTMNGLAAEILERFASVDIKTLEQGGLLNRLLAIIQRAFATSSYSEQLSQEPAHDMAAALTIIFVGALMKKDKATATIMFRDWNLGCVSGQGSRVMSTIGVSVNKG